MNRRHMLKGGQFTCNWMVGRRWDDGTIASLRWDDLCPCGWDDGTIAALRWDDLCSCGWDDRAENVVGMIGRSTLNYNRYPVENPTPSRIPKYSRQIIYVFMICF